jgi:hypothetical protein
MNFILCPRVFSNRPKELSVFRGMFDLLARFFELCLLFVEYRVVNNLAVIIEDT